MSTIAPTGHLLKALRKLMSASSVGPIHAYIVPSGDAHQGEYIAECDMRRHFISKFTGSYGSAIITLDKAALWTDGRYHLQASKQLETENWILMKQGLEETPTQFDWLSTVLSSGNKVGADPYLLSHDAWKQLSDKLKTRDITLVPLEKNLIDQVWEDNSILLPSDKVRPARPCNKLITLGLEYTGKSWQQKIVELREELNKNKACAIILTALDDIAWLFNLRGTDIEYNPVFYSYAIITNKEVLLFVDENKLTEEVKTSLNAVKCYEKFPSEPCVHIFPYEELGHYVKNRLIENSSSMIWVTNKSSEAVVSWIPQEKQHLMASPVTKAKRIKNEVEQQNMRNCHVRDSAALCEYLCWLEETISSNPDGHDKLWEIAGADYLESCRKREKHFMGLSFDTISGSGPNGAVIHYRPSEETKRPISKKELYLIDSGAQYMDGTTDVTRTVHFGEPTAKEIECFTLVLRGHIRLAMSVFPRLTKGHRLDSFARQHLWTHGLDYMHGTGHGVGMFLNVHEGPSSIATAESDDPGVEAGQVLSNEPGYYEDGEFGIRIENLVITQAAQTKYNFLNKGSLKFETITLVPIQSKMINLDMMDDAEIEWLNNYHETCREKVGEHLAATNRKNVVDWLVRATEPLSRVK